MDELRSLLSTNQNDRLKREKAALDRIDDPNLPRHTVYQGDRQIQQLGQDTIENGVIINNQSVAIGEVMLPLAKGNVLRRVDKTNGGALLGTAYRDALENDFDANGNRNSTALSRNGGNEPSDPISPNGGGGGGSSGRVPPPFGCVPPPPQCFWSTSPTAPQGFQGYGDAVVNENAVPLYLYCVAGSSVPANLGCSFLPPFAKWKCDGGVCRQDANGIYNSLAECQAAVIPAKDLVRVTIESRCDNDNSLISSLTFTIEVPQGSTFAQGATIFDDTGTPCNNDNTAHTVIINPSGLYFTGSGFTSTPTIWTRGYISGISQSVLSSTPASCPI